MLKFLSIVGYAGMVGGLLALLAMKRFFSYSPIVIALQVIGLMLMVWARIVFGRRSYHLAANPTNGGLVTRGPYKYIRHPIYTGMCLATLAGVVGNWSWPSALCGALVLVCAAIRIFCEEVLVKARYPDYAQYSASTWRMIPFVY